MKNRIAILGQQKISFHVFAFTFSIWLCSACNVSKQIQRHANNLLLQDTVIKTGLVGISIFEPSSNNYWYNYNADKYFVPASNTKLFSLYAGLKYLGDSLVAARYSTVGNDLFIEPAGDPTFLHPDFEKQPLFDLIKSNGENVFLSESKEMAAYGTGWAWDDYDQVYAAERSRFPIFGNLLWLSSGGAATKKSLVNPLTDTIIFVENRQLIVKPKYFADKIIYSPKSVFGRDKYNNNFYVDRITNNLAIPFLTNEGNTQLEILHRLTNKNFVKKKFLLKEYGVLKSQPTDSLLKPMMHNSDNFFAEQTLLMASNEHLGIMDEELMINSLLKNDLKDIPQQPNWVDGCGLSRYNLFTPQSFVYLLNKMKNEFGIERLKNILPTGGEGTLKNYYSADSTFIYAKTGSLSGTIALSGFLITRKNKLLIFSVLSNNFKGKASVVRRAVEKFISSIRNNY